LEAVHYHAIENAPPAFHIPAGLRIWCRSAVEYHNGATLKRFALDELSRSTGTYGFIIVGNDNSTRPKKPDSRRKMASDFALPPRG
jgi:hypothetical protein